MSYTVKDVLPCIGCGNPTYNRRDGTHAPQCLMCGISRAITNIRTTSAKAKTANDRERRAVDRVRKRTGKK